MLGSTMTFADMPGKPILLNGIRRGDRAYDYRYLKLTIFLQTTTSRGHTSGTLKQVRVSSALEHRQSSVEV